MSDGPRERALAYVRDHHVMTIATRGREGPWACAVFYVSEGFTLYFLSAPSTRHSADIAAHARVAATIQEDYADWPQIKGIQLEGIASELAGDDAEHARRLFSAKFPVVGTAERAPDAISKAFTKIRWYRIVPDRLYFVDNSAGFGHRDAIIPAPQR